MCIRPQLCALVNVKHVITPQGQTWWSCASNKEQWKPRAKSVAVVLKVDSRVPLGGCQFTLISLSIWQCTNCTKWTSSLLFTFGFWCFQHKLEHHNTPIGCHYTHFFIYPFLLLFWPGLYIGCSRIGTRLQHPPPQHLPIAWRTINTSINQSIYLSLNLPICSYI